MDRGGIERQSRSISATECAIFSALVVHVHVSIVSADRRSWRIAGIPVRFIAVAMRMTMMTTTSVSLSAL